MSSSFDCLGLTMANPAEFAALLRRVLPEATMVGEVGGVTFWRWRDPSGVALSVGIADGDVPFFVPWFDGEPGARLANAHAAADDGEAVSASVTFEDGEQATSLVFDCEQADWLRASGAPWSGRAAVTALCHRVSCHADEDAFARSAASLFDPADDNDEPTVRDERGIARPLRMAAESFLAYGLFGEAGEPATPMARLNGIVLSAERRDVRVTGRSFIHARLRTVGFEVDACLPDDGSVPPAGAVIAGEVLLTGAVQGIDQPWPAPAPTPG